MNDTDFNSILDVCKDIADDIKTHEQYLQSASFDFVQDLLQTNGLTRIGHSEFAGGLGLTFYQQCQINQLFGETKAEFRNVFSYTTSLAAYLIDHYGDDEQRERLLQRINDGDIISFALTESPSGSEISSISSLYEDDHSKYTVTGTKQYISNADIADKFIIFARKGKYKSAFIVDAEHVRVDRTEETMGQQGVGVSSIYFIDAPAEMIGEQGKGLRMAVDTLTRSRVIAAAIAIGMATRALNEATIFTKARGVIKHQLIQALLADSYTELYAAKAMLADVCKYEGTDEFSIRSSAMKLFAARMVNNVLDNCVQVLGGYGVMQGHIVEEFYRDARVFRIYEGTDQIQQLNIARQL